MKNLAFRISSYFGACLLMVAVLLLFFSYLAEIRRDVSNPTPTRTPTVQQESSNAQTQNQPRTNSQSSSPSVPTPRPSQQGSTQGQSTPQPTTQPVTPAPEQGTTIVTLPIIGPIKLPL